MFHKKSQPPGQSLMRASQLVEDAAFELAANTPVDLVARLIVLSAELQEMAGKCEREAASGQIVMRKYSDA